MEVPCVVPVEIFKKNNATNKQKPGNLQQDLIR